MIIQHTAFDEKVINFLFRALRKGLPNVAREATVSGWNVTAYDFQQKLTIPQMPTRRELEAAALPPQIPTFEATLQFDQGAVVSWDLSYEDGEYLSNLFAEAALNRVPAPQDLRSGKTDRPKNVEPVMKPVTNTHLGISRARITMKAAPSRPGVSIPDGKTSARVLVCECPVSPVERFFCPKIDAELLIGSEKFFEIAGCDLSQRATNPVGSSIEFMLPLFGSVLHRITISSEAYTSWDGNRKVRLVIEPHSWLDPDGVLFITSDGRIGLKELAEGIVQAYRVVTDSVTMNPQGRAQYAAWMNHIHAGFTGMPASIRCANSSTGFSGHNFGTNKKLLDWINMPGEAAPKYDPEDMSAVSEREKRILAQTFCTLTYGSCYICYKNRETAFAMIDL